jgi:probable lipoprotein NlpC
MAEAQPGDIIVFAARKGGAVDHVAILLDEGSIIHAVSQGPKTGVIISSLQDRYFGPRILGAKTFIISVEP